MSLHASHGFHRGLTVEFLAVVLGTSLGLVTPLNSGHHVQNPIDLPVTRPGQPVPDLVTGGRVDGGGATPRSEVRAVGELGDVTSTSSRAAPLGPMPCRSISVVPVSATSFLSSLLAAFLR